MGVKYIIERCEDMAGKILIVDNTTGNVHGWFGETEGFPPFENIRLLPIEVGKYEEEFSKLANGFESVKVANIETKELVFDLRSESELILEGINTNIERLQTELLDSQEKIVNLEYDKLIGGI